MFTTILRDLTNKNVVYGREDRYVCCSWDEDHVAIAKQTQFCNPKLPDFTVVTDRGMISASLDILLNVDYHLLLGDTIYKFTPNESLQPVRRLKEWNEHTTTTRGCNVRTIDCVSIVDEFISIGCKDLHSVQIDGWRCSVSTEKEAFAIGFSAPFLKWKRKHARK